LSRQIDIANILGEEYYTCDKLEKLKFVPILKLIHIFKYTKNIIIK